MEFAHSSQSFKGKTKQEYTKTMIFPTPVPPPVWWGCCGFNYSFISVLNGHLLCKASESWVVGQTESGPPGREEEASGEDKAATHHYHTDRNSSVCVCVRPSKMHKTDTDGVAGLKSCAAVCCLVLCLQTRHLHSFIKARRRRRDWCLSLRT